MFPPRLQRAPLPPDWGLTVTGGLLLAVQGLAVATGAILEGFFLALPIHLAACRYALRTAGGRLPLVLAVALGLRVLMLFSWPGLSDDVYRYLWDGRLTVAGINPYLYPPSDPAVAHLRDALWVAISAKDLHTAYPPLLQLAFAAVVAVAPASVKAMQVAAVLFDLLAIGALLALLRALGERLERAVVYAWSPLPVLQFAHSAHLDGLVVGPLLLALGAAIRGRRGLSGAALALAALAKLWPLALSPILVRRWGGRGLGLCLLVLLAGYLPFAGAGPLLFHDLLVEGREAVFNDSLAFLLRRLFGETAARLLALLMAAGLALVYLIRPGDEDRALTRRAFVLIGLGLLLSPVVEPWYLTWVLPFVALGLQPAPGRLGLALTPALAWLLLSGLVVLTEYTYPARLGPGVWPVVRLAEYGPFIGLLLLWAVRSGWRR